MKKTTFLFLAMLAFTSITIGQTFEWAKSTGGTCYSNAVSMAIDASGNVYTTGFFTLSGDFDPGPGTHTLTSMGNSDIFIQKLDANGNFLWAKSMGGITGRDQGLAIAVDDLGNVYTTGYFRGTVDFNPGLGVHNLTATQRSNVFIQKLEPNGDFIWAKSVGGVGGAAAFGIAVDASESVYITGNFHESGDFDPNAGVHTLTAIEYNDIFILKLDSRGEFAWAKNVGGGGSQSFGESIAVDGSGNVYTTGYFGGTVDFNPNAGIHNLVGNGGESFLLKLGPAGNFLWATSAGGSGWDYGYATTVDAIGNVYSTGSFEKTADFDPGIRQVNLTSAGWLDVYVQKIDPNGNLIWAKSMGGTSGDEGHAITVDALGNVYTTGRFQGTSDFDPGVGVYNLTSLRGTDIFIQKLDSKGDFVWAIRMGGDIADEGLGIAVDAATNVYTVGYFSDTVDFDPAIGVHNLTTTTQDFFIQKLSQKSNVAIKRPLQSQIKLYPNPSSGLFNIELPEGVRSAQVQIVDVLGKIVYQSKLTQKRSKLDISHLGDGVYHISMTLSTGQKNYGSIVLKK